MEPARLASELFSSPSRSFAVRLWDGQVLPPPREQGVAGAVVLRDPRALEALIPPAAETRLAEAIVDGHLDLEGDAIGLLEAAARWEGPRRRAALALPALRLLLRRALPAGERAPLRARLRGRLHGVGRDREAVRHHYDVSDDFYRIFLDDAFVYSCAYYPRGGERLEDAQRAKLDLVCRKLHLARGERFLDVGCGWGALLEHAVVRHGARGVGTTVSANQLAAARARLARAGGAGAEVRADDYRTLTADEPFDKIASVGMMEHVGRARLDAYFAAIQRLLRPGGLFLNHAISYAGGPGGALRWAHQGDGGFIWRYVFPDGELLSISETVAAAERAGFEVRDLECLREHYAETLAAWLARLEGRWAQAVAVAGERRARLYRLYLAASAVSFRIGRVSVFQLLLARRAASGRAEGLPRCRAEWYAGIAPQAPGRAASPAPFDGGARADPG